MLRKKHIFFKDLSRFPSFSAGMSRRDGEISSSWMLLLIICCISGTFSSRCNPFFWLQKIWSETRTGSNTFLPQLLTSLAGKGAEKSSADEGEAARRWRADKSTFLSFLWAAHNERAERRCYRWTLMFLESASGFPHWRMSRLVGLNGLTCLFDPPSDLRKWWLGWEGSVGLIDRWEGWTGPWGALRGRGGRRRH